MFEFLPDWIKAIVGTIMIISIFFGGFYLTSSKRKKGGKDNKSGDNKES